MSNKNYKSDINYVFELSRFVFRLLSIWSITVILAFYIVLICELVPAIFYMIIMQKETRHRFKVIVTVIFTILAMAKYGQLLFGRNQVKNCLRQVEDDWRNVTDLRDRNMMIDKAKTGRYLIICCRTIIPLSRGKIITEQNITIRHLPSPTYFVLFEQLSPAYEIVFLMQFFSGFVKCTVTTAMYGLAGLFVMHICTQLEILTTLMNNLVNESELKNFSCNWYRTIPLQYTSLMKVTGCTLIAYLLGYFIIMEWEDNNTTALCSYTIGHIPWTSITCNIFIFCFIGEQLLAKEEKVALTACTMEWYRLPNAKARSLILIMSHSPTKLGGGKFIDLSFRTFGNVVKTAVTYLNLSVIG
ncbi:hypothetical protein P5V15_009046 [Pogonomyrmex californicus]